jgi:MscS family membrane protein
MINEINDDKATSETILKIAKDQEKFYIKRIEDIIVNKKKYLESNYSHTAQIYALKKIIQANKRRGNKYAVIRDEVLIKSYNILDLQHDMIKEVLYALDKYKYAELQERLGLIFNKNQAKVQAINNVDYKPYLKIIDNSKVILSMHQNIKDYYAILEINENTLKYMSIYDRKMYTLNKYAQYKIIKPIHFINEFEIVSDIDSVIADYGFNVAKLILIFILILLVYLIRTVFYNILEKYIVEIKSLKLYSKDILGSIRRFVEVFITFVNIELVIYVYNDFVYVESISKIFNMIYASVFTFIIYKVANVIAKIKISEIKIDSDSVKSEIINVGIKVINFTIWIIGLLLVLFFAGVNLTAVLSGLGIGGFAIALAAKDSLANFFGTLNILFSNMFSQGDWIQIDGVEGTVVEIGLRVTTLRTFDNALISIPNANVANKDVKNWNRRSLGRRIKMSVGVKYDSKPEDIKNAVSQIYAMLDTHPDIATKDTDFQHNDEKHKLTVIKSKDDAAGVKKTLHVHLDEFGASSINILIYCFSKTVKWAAWLDVKQDVMYRIMEILEKNNLEFAFPSMSLYHENQLLQDK